LEGNRICSTFAIGSRELLQGEHWINLVGKGQKAGKVALPPLARSALERYLIERQIPVSSERWEPTVALIPSLRSLLAHWPFYIALT